MARTSKEGPDIRSSRHSGSFPTFDHDHGYTPGGGSISNPPEGKTAITNIYWDPDTQEIVITTE